MHFLDKLKIKYYHHQRSKISGTNNAKVQGWYSFDSQQVRFQTLCQPLELAGKSVLDLGCGYGDLKHYLDEITRAQLSANHRIASYLGIDQQSAFVKAARARFVNSANTEFINADFSNICLPNVDVIIVSGSLNYFSRELNYLYKLIAVMYESTQHAVAFNLLDSRYFTSGKTLVAYNPHEVLNFCLSICPNSQLFDNYAQNDFTIIMKH
ncbi:MAG: class I SAM-dependent methyltransferase [Oceanospirillaceae bacterium]